MNSFLKMVLKESLFGSPFASERKCIAPAVAAAGISAAASIASGVGSSVAASNLNSRNRRWQTEENVKSRNWQEKMWNEQNAYNSPLNQRKLYEEGGYNPYLMGKEDLGSGAGFAGSPSLSGQPQSFMSNPLQGLEHAGDWYARFQQLAQNQEQVDANKKLQYIDGLEKLFQIQIDAYKEGGQSLVNQIQNQYKDVFKAFDWDGSFYSERMKREFLKMDIENDRADIARMVESLYSKDTAKQTLFNLRKAGDVMDSQIRSLETQSDLNEGHLRRVASEIARNFADAFNARRQGEYYEVSAQEMTIINKMMDMQEKDQEADFAYNAAVRKYKKDLTHRGDMLGLFMGSLGAQSTSQSVQGNKFLQYGKAVTSMVGDLFKVNVGMSTNRTNFNNMNPKNNGQMFYSGDGYYMNNGVLMKQNW